jgi:hypothetical protein
LIAAWNALKAASSIGTALSQSTFWISSEAAQ